MENYTCTIIANGDEEVAKSIMQASVDNLAASGHAVISAVLVVDRGGAHDLSAPSKPE